MYSTIQMYSDKLSLSERLNVVGNWNWLKVVGGGCRGRKPGQLSASQPVEIIISARSEAKGRERGRWDQVEWMVWWYGGYWLLLRLGWTLSITSENYINTWTDSQVDFRAELPTQKEKDDYKIVLGDNVYSGHHNGLTVWLDVETWDYGYTPATGPDQL